MDSNSLICIVAFASKIDTAMLLGITKVQLDNMIVKGVRWKKSMTAEFGLWYERELCLQLLTMQIRLTNVTYMNLLCSEALHQKINSVHMQQRQIEF